MANVGTTGCGFEQQLMAAAAGLAGDGIDNQFMREDSLMVVLIVSDEEDCSMEDGPSLFESDEVQDQYTRNIACGMNQDFLYSAEEIKQMYADAKARVSGAGAAAGAVLFAAIVGVPYDEENPGSERATACQGKGSEIADCLDFELEEGTMGDPGTVQRLPPNTTSGPEATYFEYACERFDGDTPITQAYPGTRYVELAKEYGNLSYVYSICNEDWSQAMQDIAVLIAQNLSGTCYSKRLGYDPANRVAMCNAVMEFAGTECRELENGEWAGSEQVGDEENPVVACMLPKIPLPIDCADTPQADLTDINQNEFGWYYCENSRRENFSDACNDGEDNDGDGDVDCDDSECSQCGNCTANGAGNAEVCPLACRFMVTFTEDALEQAGAARTTNIQCLQEFKFEDPNCQENSFSSCNDGEDNDGNGPFDCDEVTFEEQTEDNPAHNADPACCPVQGNAGSPCDFDLDDDGEEDWTSNCDGDTRPASCDDAAAALQCLP